MRASGSSRIWIFISCCGLLGSVQGQQTGSPVASQSAAAKPRAYLRFDAPLYKAGDCAKLSLTMLDVSVDVRNPPPNVEVAVADRGRATGRISLPMQSAGGGRYETAECLRLVAGKGSAKGRSLRVAPGSVVGALARDAKGDIRAAALAVVPATRVTGKIRFSAARVASGASQTDTDRADELTDEQGRSIRFVRNHVIVLERDRGELMRFLARRHGEIVSSLGRHHLVKVDPSTADPAHLEPLAELLGGAPGRYRFSSTTALGMGALVVEELAGGLAISLDVLTHDLVQPQTAEEGGADQFMSPWFVPITSSVNFAEGMALASLFLVPSTPDITIAFIDHGFAGPDDFSPSKPAAVRDYGADPAAFMADIPQCNVGLTSTSCSWTTLKAEAAGPAPGGSPTWHGAHVASVALSTWNDSQGVGGVAFPVARPYLIRAGDDSFTMAGAIARALPDISGPSARIISLSRGQNCTQDLGLFSMDICDAVQEGLATGVACFLLQILFPPLSALGCPEIAVLITLGEALNTVSGPVKDAEAAGWLELLAEHGYRGGQGRLHRSSRAHPPRAPQRRQEPVAGVHRRLGRRRVRRQDGRFQVRHFASTVESRDSRHERLSIHQTGFEHPQDSHHADADVRRRLVQGDLRTDGLGIPGRVRRKVQLEGGRFFARHPLPGTMAERSLRRTSGSRGGCGCDANGELAIGRRRSVRDCARSQRSFVLHARDRRHPGVRLAHLRGQLLQQGPRRSHGYRAGSASAAAGG